MNSAPTPTGSGEDLIARLEAAEGGARELDREITALFYSWEQRHIGVTCWDDEHDTCCPQARHLSWVWVDKATDKWKTDARDGIEFTTSLDAALALAERLGFSDCYDIEFRPGTVRVRWFSAERRQWKPTDDCADAPLALCAAILRATGAAS